MGIKLYVWQPDGHGEYSFFVAAKSKEEATAAIERYRGKDNLHNKSDGWGTDYYSLTVLEVGQVITNDNS